METPNWITELFACIDKMDTARWITFLSDDVTFKFGNSPEIIGKNTVGEAIDGFFSSIKSLQHKILGTWIHPDTIFCQGEVRYTRHDESQITLPFLNMFGMQENLIKDYLIYIDITPLYAPAA